jgi:hypothetical protein
MKKGNSCFSENIVYIGIWFRICIILWNFNQYITALVV